VGQPITRTDVAQSLCSLNPTWFAVKNHECRFHTLLTAENNTG